MPKSATSQKGSNKKHTSITATIASQSRARRSAVATAKKNRGKPRKKLSHQQATQTRDLLDAEFRDLRVKTLGQQKEPPQRERAATMTGFSAYVSEGPVQDLAGVMSSLRTCQ